MGKVFGFAFILLVAACTIGGALLPKADPCDDTVGAFVMSQEFVSRALLAPKTASYASITDEQTKVTKHPGCKFTIMSYVDAQNGFGATIRKRFMVDLRNDGNDHWTRTSKVLFF